MKVVHITVSATPMLIAAANAMYMKLASDVMLIIAIIRDTVSTTNADNTITAIHMRNGGYKYEGSIGLFLRTGVGLGLGILFSPRSGKSSHVVRSRSSPTVITVISISDQ